MSGPPRFPREASRPLPLREHFRAEAFRRWSVRMQSWNIFAGAEVSVAAKKGTKMAAKWSPARGAIRSEPFPLLRSRSEEHTSELQSLRHLVCRLLLEKKK